MKKSLTVFAIAATFAACTNSPKKESVAASPDTVGNYSRLMADTARPMVTTGVSDTIVTTTGETFVKVDPNKADVAAAPVKSSTTKKSSSSSKSTKTSSSTSGSGSSSGSGTSTSTTTTTETAPVAAKKKGWSSAAKGTAIGAGSGAVAGAIISKNKGKGAIIGGVVGGVGGYIIGRKKDKKTGRVE